MNLTVLVVDSDLGFVFWLGQMLDLAGFVAFPAKSPGTASELIREHRLSIDILIIDPCVPNAYSFVSDLRQHARNIKVIGLIDESSQISAPGWEFDMSRKKPERFTEEARVQWLNLIENLSPGITRQTSLRL